VEYAGLYYHLSGKTKASWDLIDITGMPFIRMGEKYAHAHPVPRSACNSVPPGGGNGRRRIDCRR
jgi:hypothetical protein